MDGHKIKTSLLAVILLCLVCITTCFGFLTKANAQLNMQHTEDRIYVFSLKPNNVIYNPSADMILIESNGHYGLIDSQQLSTETLTLQNGQSFNVPETSELSSRTNTGLKWAKYMIDTLGITHLDFIIGTHAHSDHIGGMSEIANLTYKGVNLVDENTCYIYKEYHPINTTNDVDWHNAEFVQAAKESMASRGATLINLSGGLYTTDVENGAFVDENSIPQAMSSNPGLTNIGMYTRTQDAMDDYLEFQMGDFRIRLYNLYSHHTTYDENVNSIVTMISKGDKNALCLGDINNDDNGTCIKIASVISQDIGGKRIDVLKDAHHLTNRFSNTKSEADIYQPIIDISSKLWNTANVNGAGANFKYYCETVYGTRFYESGMADKAVIAEFLDDKTIAIKQLKGDGDSATMTDMPLNTKQAPNGWQQWQDKTTADLKWTYFENGAPVKSAWGQINNNWYYFLSDGIMASGWEWVDGYWYYLQPKEEGDYKQGQMRIGWIYDTEYQCWFYTNEKGQMLTGWQKIKDKWYYLQPQNDGEHYKGEMRTGWVQDNGNWYFCRIEGDMMTGWIVWDNIWYWADDSGAIITSTWKEINGKWYYFKENGAMAANEQVGEYWFYEDGSYVKTTDISGATVTGLTTKTYTGSAITQSPKVVVGGKTLTNGTDYTLSYQNNINVGTATIYIKGIKLYRGTCTKTFTIQARNISDATVTGLEDKTYTGNAITQNPTVVVNNKTLIQGTDYTLSYQNNTNVGTATVTIKGKGMYTGTCTKTFKITPKDISNATVTEIVTKTYTGSAITQNPTVVLDTKTLVNGTDYTLSYSNNVEVGTATVSINGKGIYGGTCSKTFTIQGDIATATISGLVEKGYSGRPITQNPTVVVGNKTLVKDTDYTLTYANNTNAGTATIYINGMGYYTGTKEATFLIQKKTIATLPLFNLQPNYDYTGNPIEPKPEIINAGKTLVEGVDYTVSYSANTEPGIATIIITGQGNYTRRIMASFRIQKTAQEDTTKEMNVYGVVPSYRYTGSKITPPIMVQDGSYVLKEGEDYTVTYKNNTNVGTASVKVQGMGSYSGINKTETFTITPVSIATNVITGYQPTYAYSGKAITPSVVVKTQGGTRLIEGTHYSVSYMSNIRKGTGYIVIKGIGNYKGIRLVSFKIQ